MNILASIPILLLLAEPSRVDFQLMTSPAYQAFAVKAEASCPSRKLRYLHPADLDGIEEGFASTLTVRARRQVAAFNKGTKGCAPAGASCPAQHELAAIQKAGLLDAFVTFACASAI